MNQNTLQLIFSSASNEWATPQDFYDLCNKEFNFTLDTASTKENAKCKNYYTEKDNGLSKDWIGNVWCNPPYGKETGKWIEKAYIETAKGNANVCTILIPVRSDTKYFHNFMNKADELRFIKGRLRFGGSKSSAPFPSVLFVFRKNRKYKETKISTMEKK